VKKFQNVGFQASWQASTGGKLSQSIICLSPLLLSVCYLLACMKPNRFNSSLNFPLSSSLNLSLNSPLAALNAGVVLFYGYLFFYAVNFFRWYFVFPAVVQMITFIFLVKNCRLLECSRVNRHAMPITLLFIGGSFLLNLGFINWALDRHTVSKKLFNIVREVNQMIGPGKALGAFDAGVVGYFSSGVVYNLDGLVNSYDFFESQIKLGRYGDYIERTGIEYLLLRNNMIKKKDDLGWLVADPQVVFKAANELKSWRVGSGFDVVLIRIDDL